MSVAAGTRNNECLPYSVTKNGAMAFDRALLAIFPYFEAFAPHNHYCRGAMKRSAISPGRPTPLPIAVAQRRRPLYSYILP
jgi:hypothetical protein